jgi:hypothetical protein
MCGRKHRVADRMGMRTDFAKGIDEVAVILRIEELTWMLTLFGILFQVI